MLALDSSSSLGGIMSIFAIINLLVVLTVIGLSIYGLILAIKALKIYIKKNS